MAAASRRPDPPLSEELFAEPYRFRFFQAVRLLERMRPGTVPVGHSGPPSREAVRFGALASLAFPPSEIAALKSSETPGQPAAMTVAFLGLTGPSGVLPQAYTELILERLRSGDRTAAAFLDLFNHRILSLFFRAWEKYRPYLLHERGGADPASLRLFDLVGLGMESLRGRSAYPDEVLRYDSGFFSRRHRPAIVLERILEDYFGLPAKVEQFVGRWLPLAPEDRSRLGAAGAYNGLGTSLVVGRRSWDEQGSFRLRIGPLSFAQFLAFSPDGEDFRVLVQLTRTFVDVEFDFDVQLVLKAEEVPACQLGGTARLGRTAWLKTRPFPRDAEDAVFPSGT